ncbi:MAG: tetratricopeptide repeat protein [Cyanobacteria bacterium J06623_7]
MVLSIAENQENLDNYDDLIVSIEANRDRLNLLIAVCDNLEFRQQIIEQYEREISPTISKYKIKLAPEQPSLSLQINQLIQQHPELKTAKNAVITVTGTEQFRFLFKRAANQQSPQEELLGYFQWTREAFKDFPYSIIIWVTTYLQQELERQAPDFWSWRKGVFRFQCHASSLVSVSNLKPHLASFAPEIERASTSLLPLEDLQELIAQIELDAPQNTAQLANLYRDLGNLYQDRNEEGKSANYQQEQNLAIQYLHKAIKLQQKFDLNLDLASSLNNLAALYKSQGRYDQAEPLYLQALELFINRLGAEHPRTDTVFENFTYFLRQVISQNRTGELSQNSTTRSLLKQLMTE